MLGAELPSYSWQACMAEGILLRLAAVFVLIPSVSITLRLLMYHDYLKSSVRFWIVFEDQTNSAKPTRSSSISCFTLSSEMEEFALNFDGKHFSPIPPYSWLTWMNLKTSSICLLRKQNIWRRRPSNSFISIPKILHLVLILQNPIAQYFTNWW